jgi:hypothetical protein
MHLEFADLRRKLRIGYDEICRDLSQVSTTHPSSSAVQGQSQNLATHMLGRLSRLRHDGLTPVRPGEEPCPERIQCVSGQNDLAVDP